MFKKMLLMTAAAVVSSLGVANASPVTGTAYCDVTQSYAATSPTLAQLPNAISTSGGKCASFTSSTINFNTQGPAGDSLSSYLNYQAGNVTSQTYFATAAANGGPASTTTGSQAAEGILLDLTGGAYLTNGQSITLSHDDGALLYFNGVLISPAGGNNQTVAGQSPFTYTGASGFGNFELIYTSNYLAPSVLASNISLSPAPEPNSLMLLGTGLVSAGGMFLRRRRLIA